MPVTFLAKWKTTAQLVALALVMAAPMLLGLNFISHLVLWIAGGQANTLYAAVIVKRVDAQTRSKTSINELLRA